MQQLNESNSSKQMEINTDRNTDKKQSSKSMMSSDSSRSVVSTEPNTAEDEKTEKIDEKTDKTETKDSEMEKIDSKNEIKDTKTEKAISPRSVKIAEIVPILKVEKLNRNENSSPKSKSTPVPAPAAAAPVRTGTVLTEPKSESATDVKNSKKMVPLKALSKPTQKAVHVPVPVVINNGNTEEEGSDDEDYELTKCEKCCGIGIFCPDPCPPPFMKDENLKRELIGHESFNMNTNEEYRTKYGLQSEHMRRKKPTDWIMENANLLPVEPELSILIKAQIEEAIAEAMPRRNAKGVLISPSCNVWC